MLRNVAWLADLPHAVYPILFGLDTLLGVSVHGDAGGVCSYQVFPGRRKQIR